MISNAWRWADQQAGRKRVNEVHGEEEVRLILKDGFEFMEEEGESTRQRGDFSMEEQLQYILHGSSLNCYGFL